MWKAQASQCFHFLKNQIIYDQFYQKDKHGLLTPMTDVLYYLLKMHQIKKS